MNGVFLAIGAPLLGAVLSGMSLSSKQRVGLGVAAGVLLVTGACWAAWAGPGNLMLPPGIAGGAGQVETLADWLLLAYFLWVAWDRRSLWAGMAGVLNLGLYAMVSMANADVPRVFLHVDGLARFFLVVVALVAPAVWVWAPYYHRHYRQVMPGFSERPYYFWLFAIVGIMNALFTVNNLLGLYLLWELTTLASFLLIDSPRTAEARASSIRALWMNGAGGAAFLAGTLWWVETSHRLSLTRLAHAAHAGPAVALLAAAAAVKAAQFPAARWLRGAMVAPAPVSALLHSSTMVKAGVYLVMRLSPALQHSLAGPALSLMGGLSFLGAAWLAAGSRHTKEVLAYSTISNLGLMFSMAGIGSPMAIAAALLLVAFHAVGKALLFLVAGTIESDLGSREVEVAGGLMELRPELGFLGVFGIASLYVPPLGLLFGKWMALEAAANALPLYILLAVGSGLTAFFWTKILGRYVCAATASPAHTEGLPQGAYTPMWYLVAETIIGSALVFPLWPLLVDAIAVPLSGRVHAPALNGVLPPWYGVAGSAILGLWVVYRMSRRVRRPRALPYLSGEEVTDDARQGELGKFRSTADQEVVARLAGFYPSAVWEAGSERWLLWAGLVTMLGMVGVTL